MDSDDAGEQLTLEHHSWWRDGEHTLALKHRPNGTYDAWLVEHHHNYEGGGGFGHNHNMWEEDEARTYFAKLLREEEAKHVEWLEAQSAE